MSNFIVQVFEHEISTRVVCINGKHPESTSSPAMVHSSPVVSKLSLLINYLLGKRLGYACGKMGRREEGRRRLSLLPSSFPSSPLLKSPFWSSTPNTNNERRLGTSQLQWGAQRAMVKISLPARAPKDGFLLSTLKSL